MGNAPSSSSKRSGGKKDDATLAQKVVGDLQAGLQSGIQQLEENDHPAAQLIDSLCSPYLDGPPTTTAQDKRSSGKRRSRQRGRYYEDDDDEEDESEDEETEYSVADDSRTLSEDETTATTDYHRRNKQRRAAAREEDTVESASYLESDYSTVPDGGGGSNKAPAPGQRRVDESSYETTTEDEQSYNDKVPRRHHHKSSSSRSHKKEGVVTQVEEIGSQHRTKPLASAFAKRCYFTKAGIGKTTQHYEGLTLTGNVVLMLAAAMKLKGCPTICDEDLRRVEQTYPNQFSRLPDELLLSSGWRRISKYCHFSSKPIPDGVPFFHSKQRLHPTGGYYFLLAAAVGMVRPIDVEPLNRDTLVLLETDYPTACDAAPAVLIQDCNQWTLVDRFCFFSGGPINTDEDVYYQADFDGNPIFMLAFLSPSLTPAELYKLESTTGLETVAAVEEVESVYDLTERDFDDLKLYHLGPCRALPPYILQPQAWTKVLPPHFLEARETALMRAADYDPSNTMIQQLQHQQLMAPQQQQQVVQAPHPMQPYPTEPQLFPNEQQQFANEPQPKVQAEEPNFYNPSPATPPYPAAMPMNHPYGVAVPTPQGLRGPSGNFNMEPQQQQQPPMPIMVPPPPPPPAQEPVRVIEQPEADKEVDTSLPMDEAAARTGMDPPSVGLDPPEDDVEPPSLSSSSKRSGEPTIGPSLLGEDEDEDGQEKEAQPEDEVYYETINPLTPMDENEFRRDDNRPNNLETQVSEDYSQSPSEFTKDTFPPRSPSEFSQSSAMRGAQEMLRRNRQRRALDAARKRQVTMTNDETTTVEGSAFSPRGGSDTESAWSGSEMAASEMSGTSSIWTDHTGNPDRSSRRALILQMAKARMRSNKTSAPIPEHASPHEDEKKMDSQRDSEIDLTGELD